MLPTKIMFISNMYIEHFVTGSIKAIVLLDGIPTNKDKDHSDLIKNFINSGFDIIRFDYSGTWKAKGLFLEQNPKDEVEELLLHFSTVYGKLYILGTSFGGGLALSIDTKWVSKICAVSPVIDYTKVNRIETLEAHLKNNTHDKYHLNSKKWMELLQNKLFYPETDLNPDSSKYLILAGINDDQVKIDDIKDFCIRKDIKLITYNTSHLSFSKLEDIHINSIIEFFSNE